LSDIKIGDRVQHIDKALRIHKHMRSEKGIVVDVLGGPIEYGFVEHRQGYINEMSRYHLIKFDNLEKEEFVHGASLKKIDE
jgi:hypothetical protein|tara:strand:- start:233 stop:475 length:243 start_codon:yes stop_codon:yes gene_type:complete